MGMIDDTARVIIMKAVKRIEALEKVSEFYGISPYSVIKYLNNKDNGTLIGRKVMSIEMRRMQEKKKGNLKWVPSEEDRYKGGREC